MPEVLSHGRESTLGGQYIQQFLFIGLIGLIGLIGRERSTVD